MDNFSEIVQEAQSNAGSASFFSFGHNQPNDISESNRLSCLVYLLKARENINKALKMFTDSTGN